MTPSIEQDATKIRPDSRPGISLFSAEKTLKSAQLTRADQIELLLIELKKRNLLLLPTSLDEVSRRVENNTGLRKLVKKLTR